ncbi:hypothetical protein IQ264_12775 [Phormidium sp. LEGE 05292]|uniref:hypothetical protein n=1 Tax=[Phormidium] sp. LEGE 05292 TaxID=767427 RepID=UPI00187E5EDF|nr:hypothetical protein [Phormidium sp. LEGE 05292]MBE9226297.1 hypothetical protein [Phormidium sp. LEGE 05292]
MNKIIYPTLDLFLYHQREGLTENEVDIKTNHANFWSNLPKNLKVDLAEEAKAENTEYVRLLEFSEAAKKQKQFFFTASLGGYPIEASYYPIRLNDTYALLFDSYINDKVQPQPITCLRYLKTLANYKTANLGTTWIISGYLPPSSNSENIAKELYKEFTGKDWQNPQEGKFLGATVFEIWQSPQKWEDIEKENHHILIFLYPKLQIMEKTSGFYKLWLRLFYYRNKVIWAYSESRKCNQQLHNLVTEIASTTHIIENVWNQKGSGKTRELEKILQSHPKKYFNCLNKINQLEILQKIINSNLASYQFFIKRIKDESQYITEKNVMLGKTELIFLEDFSRIVEQEYQYKIDKDYTNYSSTAKVLESQINIIRGMIDLDKKESDRTLTNTIIIASTGLATSSITASIISQKLPSPTAKSNAITVEQAFGLSIGIGLVGVAIAYLILRLFRKVLLK